MDQKIPLGLSFDDVLLVPQYSEIASREDVDLTTYLTPKLTLKLPVISANMTDVTGVEMAVTLGKLGALGVLPRFMRAEDEADMVRRVKKEGVIVAASVGLRNGMFDRAEKLVEAGASILFLDVAHGHMRKAIEATKNLRQKFGKNVDIISGNIATYEGASDLFKAGADCVKVGVGPGSICITRIETGFGVPQLSALMDAERAARRYKKTIIADGGTKNSGDIVKALAAGASAVMTGGQLAGTDEAPGEKVTIKGKIFKNYYASTSFEEKKEHIKNNGKEFAKDYATHIEGIESLVPYKGPVGKIVEKISANIRSGFSYCGARDIGDLWKRAKFVRISSQGLRESGPHDVVVKEDGWNKK
jgi:IMP dehydrogenase